MNQSTATSQHLIQLLLAAGVRHIVVAPGSRSAGLAWAAARAESVGLCRLHVRLDEREAGFLALGLAKAQREPAAVIVTSGTAAVNLLPAFVEAHYAAVPLVAVTADRPAELRGHGAPQTIEQMPVFAAYASASVDAPSEAVDWTSIEAALAVATSVRRQPVHLNLQFEPPLLPDDPQWQPHQVAQPMRTYEQVERYLLKLPARGVVVAGDIADPADAAAVADFAQQAGWPILWEPSSNTHGAPTAISHGPLIVSALPLPEAVLTVGAVGLSRTVTALLAATPQHIAVHLAAAGPDVPDPVLSAERVIDAVPLPSTEPDPEWLTLWQDMSARAAEVVGRALQPQPLTGPAVAAAVWSHAGVQDNLFVGASWPVRHVAAFAPVRTGLRVFGNRGANGIDGLVSTAYGIAVTGAGRTYALIGDVSFLYGSGGLLDLGGPAPNLTVVVMDNDGSGIFSQLEQGAPAFQHHFEKVFGTPHGRDLWQLAEALGVPACRVTTRSELLAALQRTDDIRGLHVIVCMTGSRQTEVAQLQQVASEILS